MNKEETCCLTGHRPKGLPWGYDEKRKDCVNFKRHLYTIFCEEIENGIKNFLTGMAEGFDMIGAEVLIYLKKKFKNINIIAVVPCKNQEIKWSATQQKRYKKILKKCDRIIMLSEIFTPTCMNDRNKYMVEHSTVVVACYNGKPSGTGNTIKFAKESGCKIRVINPNEYCK